MDIMSRRVCAMNGTGTKWEMGLILFLNDLSFLRLLRMKVVTQKTFKFSSQLTRQLGKVEKLKVIN